MLLSVIAAQHRSPFPAGTWRQNNVILTSMRRHDVASTLIRRRFKVVTSWVQTTSYKSDKKQSDIFLIELETVWLNCLWYKNETEEYTSHILCILDFFDRIYPFCGPGGTSVSDFTLETLFHPLSLFSLINGNRLIVKWLVGLLRSSGLRKSALIISFYSFITAACDILYKSDTIIYSGTVMNLLQNHSNVIDIHSSHHR